MFEAEFRFFVGDLLLYKKQSDFCLIIREYAASSGYATRKFDCISLADYETFTVSYSSRQYYMRHMGVQCFRNGEEILEI